MKRTLATALAYFSLAALAAGQQGGRPNVLWIVADDHAPYVYGAYGNTKVRTPNLDRLAAGGMRFDRAYCNSPVCTASRASFLTGRYPRTIGVTQLRTALPDGEITLAEILAAEGYVTAAIGKMHFNSDLKHGFALRIDRPEYRSWLRLQDRLPLPEGLEALPEWRPFRDHARRWLNGFYRPYGAHDVQIEGTYLAREARRFILAERDRPFFLMISFHEPHSPFHFPVEYRGRHDPASFDPPRPGPQDAWQIPEIFADLSREEKQGITASYYTSVEFLDKNVGLVLDALERSGKSRDTLIVYIGDHGYLLGHHGRFEKHCSFEEAVRSPLVIHFPGRVQEAASSSALVEFIDIAPTILELCALGVPDAFQGRSLVALLEGKTTSHREAVVVEYAENEEAMIRTDRYKLIYTTGKRLREDGYGTGRALAGRRVLLFDLENDPSEWTNLADRPEHGGLVDRLTRRLADHMVRTARRPELVPRGAGVHEILEFCLQPRDVSSPGPSA